MPKDAAGNFRISDQHATHANRMAEARKAPPPVAAKGGPAEDGAEHSQLHDHNDGTYHTITGGQHTEHPSIGHALIHLGAHHEPDGTHVHAQHDGMSIKSHHSSDGEPVQGPDEHESGAACGEHMGAILDGAEGGRGDGEGDGALAESDRSLMGMG